jgi:hypothetical protein
MSFFVQSSFAKRSTGAWTQQCFQLQAQHRFVDLKKEPSNYNARVMMLASTICVFRAFQ